MTRIFKNELIEVWKPLFSNTFHVKELATGKTAKATAEMAAKCAEKLRHADTIMMTTAERAFVTAYLFERFAATALYPNTFAATMFLSARQGSEAQGALAAMRHPEILTDEGSTASLHDWAHASRTELGDGQSLLILGAVGRIWADCDGWDRPVEADEADADKYFLISTTILDDPSFAGFASTMLHELKYLMHKVASNRTPDRHFFRESTVVAICRHLASLSGQQRP